VYAAVKESLLGTWIDSRETALEVIPYDSGLLSSTSNTTRNLNLLNVVVNEEGTNFKVAELEVSENVFTFPVQIKYLSVDQSTHVRDAWCWRNYRPGIDKFGMWTGQDG